MVPAKKVSKRALMLEAAPSPTISGMPLDELNIQMQKHEDALANRRSAAGSPSNIAAIMGHTRQKRSKSQLALYVEPGARAVPEHVPCHLEIIKQIKLLEQRHGIKYVPENQQTQSSMTSSRTSSTTGRIQIDHEGNAYNWLLFHQAKLSNLNESAL